MLGPRALSSSELGMILEMQIPKLLHRMAVRPGLIGWATVNGFGAKMTTPEELLREIEYDIYYVDNRSFLFDLKILLMGIWEFFTYRV